MTRITESQMSRALVSSILQNRENVNKYSQEISTGLAVSNPGDSNVSGTIALYRDSLDKIKGYIQRVSNVRGMLDYQDNVMSQVNELLSRAKEVAAQAANETNSPEVRRQMAQEVFQIRDHLVNLANSKYQGKFIYGGADDDDMPYDLQTYANPSSGAAHDRYIFDAEDGTEIERNANITDSLSIRITTTANQLFDNALSGIERLGRALEGYATLPATGVPNGNGTAYTFPADQELQTRAIKDAMDLIDQARSEDIMPEMVDLGGRMRRLDSAKAILELGESSAQEALSKLQDADPTVSISNLTQAQTALESSLTITARVLGLSILDYI